MDRTVVVHEQHGERERAKKVEVGEEKIKQGKPRGGREACQSQMICKDDIAPQHKSMM
jgi:hypothetical protein